MLRAIGFDLWETLITDTPELTRQQERLRLQRIEAILAANGYDDVAERIEGAYRSVWRRCHDLYWSIDLDISCRRQLEHFLEELHLDPTTFSEDALDAMESAYARAALEILPQSVHGAGEVLAFIRSRGLRVGLISNTGRTPGYVLREVLHELGLATLIDYMVFSNEHGECKPRPSIFEELRRGLDVAFGEMIFVGDNLHVDVAGAQRSGMRGVHFAPPVRGTAVAPDLENSGPVTADATITSLDQLQAVIDSWIGAR